jgi:hypothetical protein
MSTSQNVGEKSCPKFLRKIWPNFHRKSWQNILEKVGQNFGEKFGQNFGEKVGQNFGEKVGKSFAVPRRQVVSNKFQKTSRLSEKRALPFHDLPQHFVRPGT